MSSDYSYDEQGQFYPFFIFTLSTLVALPVTYSLLPAKKATLAPRIKTDYKPEHADLVETQRSKQKRKQRKIKRIIVALLGWALMAGMLYLIVTTQRTTAKIWNPYDILGISESATEKQIKSHYRKLSRTLHPDKAKPDPAKNETVESLNQAYVEISKAYQALTDEEIRNNYIQYGHPDGKQSFSIGIALPKFIVSDGNGKYVVLIYVGLLCVLLPYLVGSWWYGTQRVSKEGVLIESANNLFREYEDGVDEGGIVTALSTGKEFSKSAKSETGLSKLEARVIGLLSVKDREKLEALESDERRKILALLWAYLHRVDLEDKALDSAKYEVGPIAHALNQSFTAISLAYGNAAPIIAAYSTSQHLVQAIAPESSPLLQLPHFNTEVVKAIEGDAKVHTTVQQFMDRPDAERRSLVVGKGLLSDEQYKTTVSVSQQLPYLRVAKAFFKVTGERFITPKSLVTLVVKGRFIPPGSENVPEVDELDLEDVDPAEDDLEALQGKKKTVKDASGKVVKEEITQTLPPLAFAPHFARDESPKWHIFLTDSKQGKMAVPPFTFSTFDRPIFTSDGKPTFHVQTLKAQFAAPEGPGHYTFVLNAICDSYVGFDHKMEVTLVVDEPNKAAEMEQEDDISEPDEDTLAGQMNALKGGPTKSKKRPEDSSEEEESGTEEEEDDTSDTNTDTEDES